MSMRWKKPSGQIMVTQDNEATEKECLRLGFEKLGKESLEIGDPETETDEDGQPNPPEQETHEITEDEMPS